MNLPINPFSFARKIKRPLILDGAMGSLLQQRGFKVDNNVWTTKLNLSSSKVIQKIHEEYINSGADIITTNTFRTNPAAIKLSGLIFNKKFIKSAVDIAFNARKNKPVYVAGSNPPAEDCYKDNRQLSKKELEVNHSKHIDLLYSYGVHFILNETQSHLDEIKIICNYCSKNSIPYIVSLFSSDGEFILSGEKLDEILSYVIDHQPLAVGINCANIKSFNKIIFLKKMDYPWGFYLNCGASSLKKGRFITGVSSTEYSQLAADYLKYNPAFIGACCGSSPAHIKALKKLIDG